MTSESRRRLFLEEQLYSTDTVDLSFRRQTKQEIDDGDSMIKVSERVGKKIKEIFSKDHKDRISN